MGCQKLKYNPDPSYRAQWEIFIQCKGKTVSSEKFCIDYYPFGMQMPGRNGSTGEYRYGFQGQEKDDEVKGEGNSINYKYRMHDPRIGRFFAVDPLARKYPHNSPYAFSENIVIHGVELEGLEVELIQNLFKYLVPTPKKTDSYQIIVEQGSALWNYLVDKGYQLDAMFKGDGDDTRFSGFTLVSTVNGFKVNNAPIKGIPKYEVNGDLLGAGKGYSVKSIPKLDLSDPQSVAEFTETVVGALDEAGVPLKGDSGDSQNPKESKEKKQSIKASAENAVENSKPKKQLFQEGYEGEDGMFYEKVKFEGESDYIYRKRKGLDDGDNEQIQKSEFEAAKEFNNSKGG